MAIYAPVKTSRGRHVVMMKATGDPNTDGNWANVDDAIKLPDLIDSLSSTVHNSNIYVVTNDLTGRVALHVFDPGTDTWTTENELVSSGGETGLGTSGCFVRVRSDGDVIVLYTNDDSDSGVDYSRRESGVWTRDIQVDNGGGGVDWLAQGIVLGLSDRMHFVLLDSTNADIYQRTLTSANALETFPSAADTNTQVGRVAGTGVSYVSGATKIRIPYKDSDNTISIIEFDSADAPSTSITTGASDNSVSGVVMRLAIDGTNVHLLYSEFSSLDIFRDENDDDGGWGTDVEVLDAVAAIAISSNIYDRSGTKLAFLWSAGGTLTYGEVDISGIGRIMSSLVGPGGLAGPGGIAGLGGGLAA